MRKLLCGVSTIALVSVAQLARAQDAPASTTPGAPAAEANEVIVTGTRQTGLRAADSAAPIEVVSTAALTRTGASDLAISLEQNVPSLNINTTGGDIAALTIQAALRGLSPNDTLVLVNGKRRNSTSDLVIDTGSPFTGAATVDLSFIPQQAIDHVEVLTDGAAAQYGTDAVAGVINIILKTSNHAGVIDGTGGEYYEGDGASGDIQLNKGFNILDKGFFNVTLEQRYHADSVQGLGDGRVQNPDGSPLAGLTSPTSNVVNAQNYPKENQLNGDPEFDLWNGFWNGGYKVTDDIEVYTFGNYSSRIAEHYENYRVPTKVSGVTSTGATVYPFPNGFDPQEKINETDYSATGGIRGQTAGFHWDLSGTYGEDVNNIYVVHSANAQLFPVLQAESATAITPQTSFDNGKFKTTESTFNLDITKNIDVGLATPLNVAFGGEQRHDTFSIFAGEPNSYYGAGAQSFDGYTPLDQGTHGRTNYAGYIDLAADVITHLHLDVAGRYEHYSDFGSTEVGKGTARYDFNPMIAVRGTFSTGFRAPSLAEEYYSGTNVSPYSADVVLPPNSSAATVAGFKPLGPEKSTNISVGFVAHPLPKLQFTVDYYNIHIRHRILETGFIYGTETVGNSLGSEIVTVSPNVLNAIAAKGVTLDSGLSYTGISTFANAANTRTEGIEATANYASDFGEFGHVDWSLGFNYNDTKITELDNLPSVDQNATYGQVSILSPNALTALTTATPKEKAILDALWTWNKFVVNLRETIYGPTSQITANDNLDEKIGATPITDLDIGYKFTPQLKVSVGANNLFNHFPPAARGVTGGFPTGGGVVFNVPYGFSPFGINGGYYYGRVTFSF